MYFSHACHSGSEAYKNKNKNSKFNQTGANDKSNLVAAMTEHSS